MLYIGIDSGTQSTKSIVVDLETGGILASSQQNYDLIPGLPDGHMEQDPRAWIDAVDKTIQACLKQIGERKDQIRAIGVSGAGGVRLIAKTRFVRLRACKRSKRVSNNPIPVGKRLKGTLSSADRSRIEHLEY